MLEIAELQQLALFLFGGKAAVKVPHRPEEGGQPRRSQGAVGLGLRLAAGDKLQHLGKEAGGLGGAGLDGGFAGAGQPGAHPLEARLRLHPQHIGGQQVVEGLPLAGGGQAFRPAQQGQGAFQPFEGLGKFIVDLGRGRGAGGGGLAALLGAGPLLGKVGPAVGQGRFQQPAGGAGPAGRHLQQQRPPGRRAKAARGLPGGQHLVHFAVVVG